MNRRTWLLISTAVLVVLAVLGMVNAASASLPTGPLSAAPSNAPQGAAQPQSLSAIFKDDPFVQNFNCAQLSASHIDQQMNLRAAAIMEKCGAKSPQSNASTSKSGSTGIGAIDKLLSPFNYGGTDVNVHPPTSPSIQSESFVWGDGANTLVTAYNDLGTCTGGVSTSTDDGTTWAVTGAGVCSGHGSNLGDPAVVYSSANSKWVVMFLATGCGGQGIGAWSSTNGLAWTTAGCAANVSSGNGDRNSAWADNNPSSPFNGRIYASYNDFSVGGGALRTVFSTDGGATWSTPVTVFGSFRRDIQLTGDPVGANGYVYLAAMDEGGGGAANRTNYMYRSTNGGVSWTGVQQNPPYAPPGAALCSGNTYFYTITPQIRHMGWGQPASGPGGVVHYVYAQHGTGADEGNIMYTRSTDSGLTWSAPIQLNTDTGLRAQWMPSISSSPTGAVFVKWYDRRNTANNDYEIYGNQSLDNGLTWQGDQAVSDAVIPQPIVQTANCYMGDYDYHSSNGLTNQALVTWTDSRGAGSGGTQDVFFDKVPIVQGTPTVTRTGTPPTVTPTRTSTPTLTATATPCQAAGVITNGGFETGTLAPWTVLGTNPPPVVSNALPHSGTYSALLGTLSGSEPNGDGSMYQTITVPASGGTLSYWWNGQTTDTITFDWQDAYVTNTSGTILATISHTCTTTTGWVNQTFNMAPYAGQTVRIEFLVHQDGFGDDTSMYVDDVALLTACATGTPATSTRTVTPPAGGSATATPTCVAQVAGWFAGTNVPTTIVRNVGVFWPTTGHFLAVGGRTSDTAGSDFQHVLDYNPTTNTWTQNSTLLPDNQMNNMACAALTVSGTPYVYCVGGSAATQTTATARVFQYNPATDTVTTLGAADNWPGDSGGTILPGGFAVANNKLYIMGGFNINVASINQIWEFDPNAAVGSKWVQKVNAPEGIMYAPTAYSPTTGLIYVLGASDYSGGTVVDTTNSFSFNPTANTIGTITPITRAVGETRAVRSNDGTLWVLGGGRVAPNPSTEVDVFNPSTNSWSLGPAMITARRNFAADSDPATGRIWTAGGYDSTGLTATNVTEIYRPAVGCGTATPTTPPGASSTPTRTNTPTNTPPPGNTSTATRTNTPSNTPTNPVGATNTPTNTSTNTPQPSGGTDTPTVTVTSTACPIQFTDVPNGSTFYPYIRCLACRLIINGYTSGCETGNPCFRPNNNVTRGQLSKIVSNSAGFSDPQTTQMFQDVPPTGPDSTFFVYIGRLASRGYINGYDCGGPGEPCVPPANLPYFRQYNNATRGQISKIVSNAAGFNDPPAGQIFEDVPPGSTFYTYTQRLASRGVMQGYQCGSPGEPCIPPNNRPYFRPFNNATRGQTAKIVANTFFPNCDTPSAVKQAAPNQ